MVSDNVSSFSGFKPSWSPVISFPPLNLFVSCQLSNKQGVC